MKILFLALHPIGAPATKFRICQYLPLFRKAGHQCRLFTFFDRASYRVLYTSGNTAKKVDGIVSGFRRWAKEARTLMEYDLVFISREVMPLNQALIVRTLSRIDVPIIYDLDDAVFLRHRKGLLALWESPKSITNLMRLSVVVIAGNEYLEDFARNHNRRVYCIPTAIDTNLYRPGRWSRDKRFTTLGWVGTHTTAPYFHELSGVLRAVSARYQVKLRVIGARKNIELKALRVENVEWRIEDAARYFNQIDIGLYPLPDTDWARGKCGLKGIQYMASGTPCVASAVGVNKVIITDGYNGFLCSNQEEWISKLSQLIESPELRNRFAQNGRRTVERYFSVRANFKKYLDIFHRIANLR